ncbi:hypothetical protein RCG67_14900 [Kocuria sp. CPCC 205292]|uniref:hypothetical protein n=1 Tax=Kocuria cellulosilytica TaxID=3071451 RepID=UPI0034D4DB24
MDSIRTWVLGLFAAALLTLWLLPIPGGSKLWILAVLVFAGVFTLLESTNKAKLLAAAMVSLLVVYLGLSLHRAVLLLGTDGWIAKAFGAALLVLPAVGVWALVREVLFGVRTEQLGRTLHAEGGLPPDDLPRTPGGRIVREAADERFGTYRAQTEEDPGEWRNWYRLSLAYAAAGDRTRARAAMRDAVALSRGRAARGTEPADPPGGERA